MTVTAAPALWARVDHLDARGALAFASEVEAGGVRGLLDTRGAGREPLRAPWSSGRGRFTLRLGTGISDIYARDATTARAAANTS